MYFIKDSFVLIRKIRVRPRPFFLDLKIKTAHQSMLCLLFSFYNGSGLLFASRPVGIIIYHNITPRTYLDARFGKRLHT
jgi:hypothetical protein